MALGLVSLLTDVSSELLVYVIPLFLANVLAASPTVIGVIEGVAESVAAFVRLGSGALSDRFSRRTRLVFAGYAMSVVGKALYLVASTWPIVLVARVGDRIGKGIRTAPRDALIADSTPPDARGRAFGLHRAMDTLGALIGVSLAAVIIELAQGDALTLSNETFKLLAAAALIPGVLALVVIAVAVRDVRGRQKDVATPPEEQADAVTPWPTGSKTSLEPPVSGAPPGGEQAAARPTLFHGFPTSFWIFVAASGLFTIGNSSDAFLAVRSQALGVTVRDLMLVVVAFNLVNTLIAWPVGALSDRIGRRRLIAIGWALYATTYVGFALASGAGATIVFWILYGAYYGVNEAVGRAFVADLAPTQRRATAFGIVNAVIGLAILPASVIAGLLWDHVGPAMPFWFGAACAIGGLVLLAYARPVRATTAAQAG